MNKKLVPILLIMMMLLALGFARANASSLTPAAFLSEVQGIIADCHNISYSHKRECLSNCLEKAKKVLGNDAANCMLSRVQSSSNGDLSKILSSFLNEIVKKIKTDISNNNARNTQIINTLHQRINNLREENNQLFADRQQLQARINQLIQDVEALMENKQINERIISLLKNCINNLSEDVQEYIILRKQLRRILKELGVNPSSHKHDFNNDSAPEECCSVASSSGSSS